MTCNNQKYWDDPVNRKKRSEQMKRVHAEMSPEKKAIRGKKISEHLSDPIKDAGRRQKISKTRKARGFKLTDEQKEHLRKKAIANRNAMTPEEIEKNHKKAVENLHKAVPDFSARAVKLMNEGKIGIKGWYFSKKSSKNLFYRSTYELSAFQILEQMSVVKRFTSKTQSIKYEFEGKTCRYLPDILVDYLDGSVEVIEVKAECFRNDLKNQAKFKAARKWCAERRCTFSIWTEVNEPRLLQNVVAA